ncbi:MAG: T9SS type A sorting domain-containing protein [Candidatus Krumholzibacteria bacterium]|nr:T9SS type A sorting domain-containing protein [Candidatus Krumholzibacteria bacterium]
MLTRTIPRAALAAILIIAAAAAPSEAWTTRGLPVCAAEFEQSNPMMVSDGAGGAIVVWEDYRSSDWNIYAQRIDGAGMALWTADGLLIVSASGADSLMQVVAGGAGEAIILWKHGTNMYAQKIDAAGTKLWTSGGKRIYTTNAPFGPRMIADGGGGAIVAWIESRSGSNNVYAQRLAYDGTIMWTDPGGITVSAAAGNESHARIASDGAGGALVAFVNNATATPNVYVQRVRSSGAIWGSGGVVVGTNTYPRSNPAIASDGDGGAIVAWEIGPSGDAIAAMRIGATGTLAWASGGVFLCYVDEAQTAPEIIEDGAGGAVVIWRDERSTDPQLFAQKIDRYGQAIWTADGVQIFDEGTQDANYYRLLAAGGGRVFVVFDEQSHNELQGGILNFAGESEWGGVSIRILAGDVTFGEYGVVADGAGGLLAAVIDDNPGAASIDITAQGINRFGRVSVPEPRILDVSDVPDDQGGKLRIRVAASDRDSIGVFDGAIASYGVWQRIDGAGALAELRNAADREMLEVFAPGVRLISHKGRRFIEAAPAGIFPGGSWEYVGGFEATQSQEYIYRATTIADSSSAGAQYSVYVVSAHSADPAVWFASTPDSGCSVDNLPPGVPEGLAGEQGYSPAGLSLAWSLGAENDLSHYAVYRGTSEDFVPDPDNLAATPTEPGWFDGEWRWDGGYYYKVAAVDVHDNESGYALLGPDDVTGADSPRAPEATYLAQNFPNPFNPVTKIAFGLKGPAEVKLGVYDASGRLVRMLVEGARPAGRYTELWDGRNARGAAVASGIYFYRLDAGAFGETRKMVIMR